MTAGSAHIIPGQNTKYPAINGVRDVGGQWGGGGIQ